MPAALLNLTGTIPGPLNVALYQPFTAPNASGVSPGGGPVFVAPGVNGALTVAALPAPVNLTAQGKPNPWSQDPGISYANGTKVISPPAPSASGSASSGQGGKSNGALGLAVDASVLLCFVAGVVAGVITVL